jgi:hypothetical protein
MIYIPISSRPSSIMNNIHTSSPGLQGLPLELRNDIYEYTIGDVNSLTIPPGDPDSWLQTLYDKVLSSLHINRQIEDEAKEVVLTQVMRVVKEVTLPDPDDLLSVVPFHIQFANIHRLRFTRPQRCLDGSLDSLSSCVNDLVQRCPQLQELTIPISATIFLEGDYRSHFSTILENKNMSKLHLTCSNTPRSPNDYVSAPDATVFQPFEEWFLREGTTRERHIALDIDLTPNTKYKASDPQCSRRQVGCIRWIEFCDFFG